mgnify:CR=1 FL=1
MVWFSCCWSICWSQLFSILERFSHPSLLRSTFNPYCTCLEQSFFSLFMSCFKLEKFWSNIFRSHLHGLIYLHRWKDHEKNLYHHFSDALHLLVTPHSDPVFCGRLVESIYDILMPHQCPSIKRRYAKPLSCFKASSREFPDPVLFTVSVISKTFMNSGKDE